MKRNVRYAVLHQYEAMQIVKHRVDFPFWLYNKILETPSITETKYCGSANGGSWTNASNAENAEDSTCALSSLNGSWIEMSAFGFAATKNPTKVYVDCKVITVSSGAEQCDFYVWNGSSWEYFATIDAEYQLIPPLKCGDSYFRGWHDISAIINTKELLNAVKFRAYHYQAGGGGVGFKKAWSTYIDAIKVKATH